jgi:hypothetical protein
MTDDFELQTWQADEFMAMEFPPEPGDPGYVAGRHVRLTPASLIEMRPVHWLWSDRIPAGEIALVPGREGIGKSLFLAWLCAQVTRGTLPGEMSGKPAPVIYAATEDSWSSTIAPRLWAAGADLHMVYRVDVETPDGAAGYLTLPADCEALGHEIERLGVALLAADPLLSLIGAGIDTHRDRDVRTALEPLARMGDRTGCAVVGLAHFNKSSATDSLNLIGGSRAFSAVCRAALPMARDTEADDGTCIMSMPKSTHGANAPSLRYRIDTAEVPTAEGPAPTGRLVFLGETDRSVDDILSAAAQPSEGRAERDEAAAWLTAYLEGQGGAAPARDVIKAARADGIAERTLYRARDRAKVTSAAEGFPARSTWRLPTVRDMPSSATPPVSGSVAEQAEQGPNWQNSARSVTNGVSDS